VHLSPTTAVKLLMQAMQQNLRVQTRLNRAVRESS
jgi:hypothetical protein